MERVTTLKKEKGTRSFTKLKININDDSDKIIDKMVKFIAKDLTEEKDLSDFNNYLKFNNFYISYIDELSKENSNKIRNTFYKKDTKNYYQAYYISMEDINLNYLDVITNTVDISPRARRSSWGIDINSTYAARKVCDIKYFYGMLKLLDLTYEYCYSEKEILSENFSEYSAYGNTYTLEDINTLIRLDKIQGARGTFFITRKIRELIIDVILIRQASDYNIELMEKYSRDIHSEVARAFETKKNIPQRILKVMKNNKFLENFSYVELDSDTDLEKFSIVEKEFLRIRKLFNMSEVKKAELRIRKLGKHKALGLYYPGLICLCVDITSPSSFMHEFAHHLDYTASSYPLSLSNEFRTVIREYTKRYDSQIDEDTYLKRKRNYFLTPTEIFARTFEMYLVEKGVETSFLKDKKDMKINNGYPKADKKFMNIIISYFDNFNFNFKALEENEALRTEIQDTMKTVIEDIKYSALKQVSFF